MSTIKWLSIPIEATEFHILLSRLKEFHDSEFADVDYLLNF